MKVELTRFNGRLTLSVLALGVLVLLGACSTTSPQSTAHAKSIVDLPAEFTQPKTPPALGWAQFGDPALDTFIALGLQNNQDLQIAIARLEQARAAQTRSALNKLPTLDLGASANRDRASINDPQVGARASQPGFDRTSSSYRLDASFNWELDLFGRKDALQSADEAREQAAQANAQDIRLTVVTDVAKNVITARTLQVRVRLAQEAAATESQIVAITRAKLRGGQISAADLLRATSLEQDSQATAARLQHDYGETIKALAVLMAERPDFVRLKLLVQPEVGSYSSAISSIMATGFPADLLRRRPDIQRAEFQLAAASKDLAASNAERFPTFKLGATLALVAGTVGKLGGLDSLLASVAPSVSWRALDFGRLDADIARATGVEKEALIAYKKSVTTAFAEADTAIDDVARRQLLLQRTTASAAAQREAWDVVRLQYERGITDLTTALDTQRTLTRSQDAQVLALQEQLLATVTVYRTLGGDWLP
jgi:outer membrane protein, multidrug efflux system